jgi:hypothetical protein
LAAEDEVEAVGTVASLDDDATRRERLELREPGDLAQLTLSAPREEW